jgi:hypothetical protein
VSYVEEEYEISERHACRHAGRFGAIDESLSSQESRARRQSTNTLEGAGGAAHAVLLPAVDGDAAARRDYGQSQAGVPAVSLGSVGDADSGTTAPTNASRRIF